MKLEYVSSGNSSLKVFSSRFLEFENTEEVNSLLNIMKGLSRDNNFYSILFNAFTEVNMGKVMYDNFKDYLHSIHTDSGGLQMITLGKTITEEEKEQIYKIQGQYSDAAMCFDEIPVVTDGVGVGVTDMKARYFDKSKVKEKAIITGNNVKNQIKLFKEFGYKTKPMLILQGNSFDTFKEWMNFSCDVIGDDLKFVHGISVAGTSLGGGPLEDIVRAASTLLLDFPEDLNYKNIHMLGVGSSSRFTPYIPFKNKLEDYNISFDSTTHSHAIFKGTYVDKMNTLNWNKQTSTMKDKIVEDINTFISDFTELRVTKKEVDTIFKGSLEYEKVTGKLGAHCPRYIFVTFCIFATMIDTSLKSIRELFSDKKTYMNLAKKRGGVIALNNLSLCENEHDFNNWWSEFSRFIKSDRVKDINDKPTSLEEFF